MNTKVSVLLLGASYFTINIAAVHGALFWGSCPSKNVAPNFSLSSFQGRWYEYSRFGSPIFELGIKCVESIFSSVNESVLIAKQRGKGTYGWWRERIVIVNGTLFCEDKTNPRKMRLKIPSFLPFFGEISIPFWILSVDYQQYSIIWSCRNFVFFNIQHAWVLTRKNVLPDMDKDPAYVKGRIYEDLKELGFDHSGFELTDHTYCT